MAVLIGMSAEVKGKTFNVDREKITIGRNATNLIVIEHPTVSGRHCQILHDGKRYTIMDLGSTNGTRVNSREITECDLKPKDLVQIGSVEFMFDAEDIEARETPALSQTQVEIATGPASSPPSFGSMSPFGARRRDNMLLWYLLIGVIGLLALVAAGAVIYLLFGKGAI
jgi:predicted component of type VI protein secretion system